MNLDALKNAPRLLIEATLQPIAGTRFQPTGFPDLGAAQYKAADGAAMLLVESAQSMANRLEEVCWDHASDDLHETLRGLPYVRSTLPDGAKTNSILEAHRINSPYIVNSEQFSQIEAKIGFKKNQPFHPGDKLAKALLHYDPCSLIHGIFLEKVGGVVRLPRLLTGFIEASDAKVASSGGVKIDRVQPETTGKSTPYGKADDGYGNVPYARENEFTGNITAYFIVDLALLRGFGFAADEFETLFTLSLWKIRRFLETGLRLRTACDLELSEGPTVTRPSISTWQLPSTDELASNLKRLVPLLKTKFGPSPLEVTYSASVAKARSKKSEDSQSA
jgi:CRISPR-associated protein Csb1